MKCSNTAGPALELAVSVTIFYATAVAMLVQVARDCRALPEGLLHAAWGCRVDLCMLSCGSVYVAHK